MSALRTLVAATLAVAVFGTTLATPALAESTAPTTATPPTERQLEVAIDALHEVLGAMVQRGLMRPLQRDVVLATVRAADWDGYSIERLGSILEPLVDRGVIGARQRDAILYGVRHARNTVLRLAVVLDTLTPSVLRYAQRDAVVDALHRADWDGF